jgi:oligogalacturonide lyase
MSHHDCREEPNVRFSPDKNMVFFTSHLFGASYVFGVEVKKAENPAAADVEGHGGAVAAVEAAGSGAWEVG